MEHGRSLARALAVVALAAMLVSGAGRPGREPCEVRAARAPVVVERGLAVAEPATSPQMPSEADTTGGPDLATSIEASAWPAVRAITGDDGAEIAEGELLVTAAPGRSADVARALQASLPVRAIRTLAHTDVLRVRLEDGADLASAVAVARATEGAAGATPNAIVRGTDRRRAPSSARAVLWNVQAMHLPARAARLSPAAHVVALLDSGVAYERSPGLAGVEIVAPLDAIDGDAVPQDENGHGTFLANLLVGAPGLARGAALMPVRVLDADLVGTEAGLLEALAHARAEGADVVNLSLVYGARYMPTRALDAAIAEALAAGVVIVAAAGNDGSAQVRYPAAFPGVVAVGASTPGSRGELVRAPYSSHGAALDFLAPGGDLDADRNRDGWADGILAESFDPRTPDRFEPWLAAGTSQAAAHASAVAVLLLGADVDPRRMPEQLRETARGGRFDVTTGGGWLDVGAALARRVEVPPVGARTLLVFRELEGGARGVVAPIAIHDANGAPIAGARAHARFRGAIEARSTCTTGRDGACAIEVGPSSDDAALVAMELEAVVLRGGVTVRPATIVTERERDAALDAIDGVGFGSSSSVWIVSPQLLSLSRVTTTYVVYGSGDASALAPTVVAFDDAVARTLEQDVALLSWDRASLPGTIEGGGFGSSSTTWSGWSFLWSGWGSPVYGMFGALSINGADEARVAVR